MHYLPCKTKRSFKKHVATVLFMVLSLQCLFTRALADEADTLPVTDGGPQIASEAAVVMDVNSGAVLYAKNQTEALQPSSLTKLMTAYIALDENLSGTMAVSVPGASNYFDTASNVGYHSTENIRVIDALRGMLMISAEDCTYTLAEKSANTMDEFAVKMNDYTAKLGLENSHFANGMGVNAEGHYSCAYDMAKVAALLMRDFPEYKQIVSAESITLAATNLSDERSITSTHRFINGRDDCPNVYAGKTGGSAWGGDDTWALCTYASGNGLNLVCIIMGAPENGDTYEDTKTLFEYAFENYRTVPASSVAMGTASEIDSLFAECPLFDAATSESVETDGSASLILPASYDKEDLSLTVSFNQLDEFINGANIIGSVSYYLNDRPVGHADIIYYTQSVSMSAEVFNSLFPSYLSMPEYTPLKASPQTPAKVSNTFFNRFKATLASFYTTAKLQSFLFALLLFIIGTVLIIVFLPGPRGLENRLYARTYENRETVDSETSEVRRMRRNEGDSEMHEIGGYGGKNE